MNKFISTIIINAVGVITSKEVTDKVIELVRTASSLEITGEEKRAQVKAQLKALTGELGTKVQGLESYIINLAIEAAVAFITARTAPK